MRGPTSISNRRLFLVAALALLVPVGMTHAGSMLESMDSEVAALYEKSKDAVVKVHTELAPSFARPTVGPTHRVGTGFFIDGSGHLVTAGTLVEGAATCWIDWQGRRVEARILGRDPNTNLAVLKVDPDLCVGEGQLPIVGLGNSDELRVGSMVVAIGFPYELPSAPVVGFVSGLDIKCGQRVFPVSYIRAGCRLRPGQGGGPLLDAHGEVVGVIVAAQADDQCYSAPAKAVKKICADIIEHGEPQYGWVGLNVTERQLANDSCAAPRWQVLVQEVYSNAPAALAGFQPRDVLLRICTNEMRRSADVLNTMFYQRCGQAVTMVVLRDGATQEVNVLVGHRPPPATAPEIPGPRAGPAAAERR